FGAWWGGLVWLYHGWSESATVTAVFAVALAAGGLFARYYTARARSLRERALSLIPLFRRQRAVTRAVELRAELLTLLQGLAARYEVESGTVLLPEEQHRFRHRIPKGRVAAVVLVGFLAWFLAGLRGTALDALERKPSPWETMDRKTATMTMESDAAKLARVLGTLRRLETEMNTIRGGFDTGERDFYSPEDNAAIRTALNGYLTCRKELLSILWFYRHADTTGPEELRSRAWLLAYVSSVELASRGMQLVDTFDGHPDAVKKLNEGDTAWDVKPGVYDRIRSNLSDSDLLDQLVEATEAFQEKESSGRFPDGPPWEDFRLRGADGAAVVRGLGDRLWAYKWDSAVQRLKSTGDRGRYSAASRISTWVGDARIRSRTGGHGLVQPAQLKKLEDLLEPGDVLIERRNWYLSNAFLPGFWPHAAIYVGGEEGLQTLGIAEDPRVRSDGHLKRLREPDHDGHEKVVIEAISDGVVFTSLEESIGGADAVCVLRPRLPRKQIAEAVARAISHEGKPYDFDFDFFSTDRLVCTEVVYQAYQEYVEFELPEIMGRRALPALDIVRRWAEERDSAEPTFDLIHFLDSDEENGVAVEAGADALVATLDRPGMTLLHEGEGGLPLLLSPIPMALLAMLGAALFLFPRSTRRRKDAVTLKPRAR
ncbi:MAG: YiiX/YebB-like N1pC/P60 family cysteine hydrolase, partial [Planctomycetota bacterium]